MARPFADTPTGRRAWRDRGSSGPAGPCHRIDPLTGARRLFAPIVITPPVGGVRLTGHAPKVGVSRVGKFADLPLPRPTCPHCAGTGFMPPPLVPLIAAAVAGLPFTTNELQRHAEVIGGPLQAALSGKSVWQLGRELERLAGQTFDGYRLVRLGRDRGRVALWRIYLPE